MMTDLETLWHEKSDEEVMEAGARLGEYTLEGQGVIRAELLRRGLRPAQPQPSFLEGDGSGTPDAGDHGHRRAADHVRAVADAWVA